MAITKCLFTDSEIDTASPGGNDATWAAILQLRADVEGRLIGQRMPDACVLTRSGYETARTMPKCTSPRHWRENVKGVHSN